MLADSQLETFLQQLYSAPIPLAGEVSVEAQREASAQRAHLRPRGPEMVEVVDLDTPGLGRPARLYRPLEGSLPLALFLHGGGWVIGSLDTHDRACRRLAAQSGWAILSLDYRLAPEFPWPAAVEDTWAALGWIASAPAELGSRPPLVAVMGDSAGGTLAALACLRARDEDPSRMPDLQVLVYANTDLADESESLGSEGHGYGLEEDAVEWFTRQWVPDATRRLDPRVSPLRAETLRGLCRTVVVTCEHDPLRDQGEAFAQRLEDEGVAVVLRREVGMVHNFLLWDLVSPACAAASERVAEDLRDFASSRLS